MKNLLIAAFVLATFTGFAANEEKEVKKAKVKVVTLTDAKKANLYYVADSKGRVTVNIYNENGIKVYTDNISVKGAFQRPYDFSDAEGSEFIIEVIDGQNTFTERVVLSEENTAISGEFIAIADQSEEGKVNLKVLKNNNAPIAVRVISSQSNNVYSHNINVNGSFIQKYDISDLKGNIVLEITSGNNVKSISL
jgi:flagellar hook assembly protein FlgD